MATVKPLRLASGRDILGLAQMAAGWLLTAFLPQKLIQRVARALAALHLLIFPGAVRKGVSRVRCLMDPAPNDADLVCLFREHHKRTYEHLLGRILDTHRRGWHPQIDLEGVEHVRHSLGQSRGVIFWGMSFCGPVIPKAGLFQAGFRVVHLSIPFHGGFSKSWVARRLLNPWTLRSENKYLAERLVIPPDGSLNYLRTLKQRLRDNGCVSIMGEHKGIQNVGVPFLSEQREFATGAPNLARSTGAALLTVYSHRIAPFHYRVVIEPPIAVDCFTGRAEYIKGAIEQFAQRLTHQIRMHPEDWEGWSAPEIAA